MDREIKSLAVFTGKQVFHIELEDYDRVVDASLEYPDGIDRSIIFYKGDKIVRTMWNPSCDIRYK